VAVEEGRSDAGIGAPMADLSAAGVFVALALILLVVAARLEKL
jgi:hypothetical protein